MQLKSVFLALALAFVPSALLAAERYEFDKSHTSILFFVNHLGFSDMVGEFKDYDGHFMLDEMHPEKSSVDVILRPAGIDTDSPELNKHLQGKDFFNAEAYPEIRFESQAVKRTGERTADVAGEITMLGVTRPVTLKVRFNKAGYHPLTNHYVAGFTADATLLRSEFGMTHLLPLVGDEVHIHIEAEGINAWRKGKATKQQ